jgi:hypothetical protein
MIANFSKQHGQQDFSVMKIHDQAMDMPVIWLVKTTQAARLLGHQVP